MKKCLKEEEKPNTPKTKKRRKRREGWRGTKISFNEGKKYEGIVRKRRDTITYFARNKKRRNKG